MANIVVPIASDHRGFSLKTAALEWLRANGYAPLDLGTHTEDRCDAGDYVLKVVRAVREDPAARGILICGTGQAMAMTANRYQYIRAALCVNATMARMAREHNDANILALGAHIVGQEVAMDCVKFFLATPFLGGRYAERCAALEALGGLT